MSRNPVSRRSRTAVAGVAFATFALLLAACGSDADTGPSASAGAENEEGSDLEAPDDPEAAFELFDQCMSDAGLNFGGAVFGADTEGGGSGAITISPVDGGLPDDFDPQQAGSPEDFDFEEFEEANQLCEGHLANLDAFSDMSPDEQAAFEDAQLEFTRCMEDQGIEMPDFDSGGGGIVIGGASEVEVDPQTGQPSFDDAEFDGFNEAAEACNHHFDGIGDDRSGS